MLRNDMQPESINFPILMPGIFLATMNTLIVNIHARVLLQSI